MEFGLGNEQRILQDSINDFLRANCPLDVVRRTADAGTTCLPALGDGLTALGIPGVLIPEAHGGVGLQMLDAALVAEALGAAVAPMPFIGSAVMAPVALLRGGSAAQQARLLPGIAAGEIRFGVGVSEHTGRRDTDGIAARGDVLDGKAMFVLDGMDAHWLLLADREGGLHLVAADAAGVSRTALQTIDRTRSFAEVRLDGVRGELLRASAGNRAVLQEVIDAGRLMLAADTLGAAQTMLDRAVTYARERKQFDRAIGSFQAVKHLCAEMASELEPCRSLLWYAAHASQALPDEARVMACHAKAHLAEVGRFVARTATEVHGGMGFTDLLGLHYWFKRIGVDRQLLGTPERVREEAAALQGFVPAA